MIAGKLPKHEEYGLASQLQRAAVSIPSNIAEGHQRNNPKEYRQFLGIARGSSAELETQLLLMRDIYNINVFEVLALLSEVQKMLTSILKKFTP